MQEKSIVLFCSEDRVHKLCKYTNFVDKYSAVALNHIFVGASFFLKKGKAKQKLE